MLTGAWRRSPRRADGSTWRRILTVAALTLIALTYGCPSRARFRVVHPAMLNATPYGNSFTVGQVDGHGVWSYAAQQVRADLEQRIVNSLNASVRLMPGGGGLTVAADIMDNEYTEEVRSAPATCSRTVQTGTDAQGRAIYGTQQYACTYYTRYGRMQARVRYQVIATSSGQVLVDRSYTRSAQPEVRGEADRPPPPIDSVQLLLEADLSTVEEFARIILPWPEEVVVQFTGCGGGEGCDDALRLVRAGDLEGADAIYTRILGSYDDPGVEVVPDDEDLVAQTLYNRGVVRGYAGHYVLSLGDLQRACELEPGEGDWRARFDDIQRLAADQEALESQGAVAVDRQSVEQAGSP